MSNPSSQKTKIISLTDAIIAGDLAATEDIFASNCIDIDVELKNGMTPYLLACHSGHMHLIQYLQEKGVDISRTDSVKRTHFHLACMKGHLDIVQYILTNSGLSDGAVNAQSSNGSTAFYTCCQDGFVDIVKYLVDHGVDVNLSDHMGRTPFSRACSRGHLQIVEYLLQLKTVAFIRKDNDGNGPFMAAAFKGHIEVLRVLTAAKCDDHSSNNDGKTPIVIALLSNQHTTAKILMKDSNALIASMKIILDTSSTRSEGLDCIDQNIFEENNKLKEMDEKLKVSLASRLCSDEIFASLFSIARGKDHATADRAETIARALTELLTHNIFAAIHKGDWETTLNLATYGATIKDEKSNLPLHYLLRLSAPAAVILRVLEVYPLAVCEPDNKQCLPLHLAAANQGISLEVILRLLKISSTNNVTCESTATAAHGAPAVLIDSSQAIADIVTTTGTEASIETKRSDLTANRKGRLPIHEAIIARRNPEIIMHLLQSCPASATVAINSDKKTALHLLVEHSANIEVIQAALAAYPDGIAVVDNKRSVPLAYIRIIDSINKADTFVSLFTADIPGGLLQVPSVLKFASDTAKLAVLRSKHESAGSSAGAESEEQLEEAHAEYSWKYSHLKPVLARHVDVAVRCLELALGLDSQANKIASSKDKIKSSHLIRKLNMIEMLESVLKCEDIFVDELEQMLEGHSEETRKGEEEEQHGHEREGAEQRDGSREDIVTDDAMDGSDRSANHAREEAVVESVEGEGVGGTGAEPSAVDSSGIEQAATAVVDAVVDELRPPPSDIQLSALGDVRTQKPSLRGRIQAIVSAANTSDIFGHAERQEWAAMLECLQQDPSSAELVDHNGRTWGHYAIHHKAPLPVLQQLMNCCDGNVKTKDCFGKLPLHYALHLCCSLEIISALLGAWPEGAMVKDSNGSLPLHIALSFDHTDQAHCDGTTDFGVIDLVLRAYPEAAGVGNISNELPLHIALRNKAPAVLVTHLLELNPDAVKVAVTRMRSQSRPKCSRGHDMTKFQSAASQVSTPRALLPSSRHVHPLKKSVAERAVSCRCDLCRASGSAYYCGTCDWDMCGSCSIKDRELQVALAEREGKSLTMEEAAEATISSQALEPNQQNVTYDGNVHCAHSECEKTPPTPSSELSWSCDQCCVSNVGTDYWHCEECACLQVKYCFQCHAPPAPRQGRTATATKEHPLHLAIQYRHSESACKAILALYPEAASMPSINEELPLHLLLRLPSPSLELIELLVSASSESVKRCDKVGDLPLHAVIASSHPCSSEVVDRLLDMNSEAAGVPNSQQMLPLHLAASSDVPVHVLTKLLAQHPAGLHMQNSTGKTPLQCALADGARLELVEVLVTAMKASMDDTDTAAASNRAATRSAIFLSLSSSTSPAAVTLVTGSLVPVESITREENIEFLFHAVVNCLPIGLVDELIKRLVDGHDGEGGDSFLHTIQDSKKRMLLHTACKHSTAEIARLLLERGCASAVNTAQSDLMTPLLIAAQRGSVDIIAALLAHEADLNFVMKPAQTDASTALTAGGRSALYFAASAGHIEALQALVAAGADVNVITQTGKSVLWMASSEGHLAAVIYLHSIGCDIDKGDLNRDTPLLAACEGNHTEVIKFLVSHGADVNTSNRSDILPLAIAIKHEDFKVASILIAAGADVNAHDKEQQTLLISACEEDDLDIAKFLVDAGADVDKVDVQGASPLFLACDEGHLKIAEYLVSAGADINKSNGDNESPLYIACQNGHLKIVQLLVCAGANLNQPDKYLKSPFSRACSKGHRDVVEYLLATPNIDFDAPDNEDASPLYWATAKGHSEIVKLIVEGGAEADGHSDSDPFYVACQDGYFEIAKCLAAHGAHLDRADEAGRTPFSRACSKGHFEIVKWLAGRGVDINSPDEDGDTPLHYACLKGHKPIIDFLVTSGADFDMANSQGKTPMSHAVRLKDPHIIRLLSAATNSIALLLSKEETRVEGLTCLESMVSRAEGSIVAKEEAEVKVAVVLCDAVVTSELRKILQREEPRQFSSVPAARLRSTGDPSPSPRSPSKSSPRLFDRAATLLHHADGYANKDIFGAIAAGNWALVRSLAAVGARVKDKNHKLPLHRLMASQFSSPPLEVVQAVLTAFPDATKGKDKNSRLPLHFAAGNENVPADLVTALVTAYPVGLTSKDKFLRTPLHYAAANTARISLTVVTFLLSICVEPSTATDISGKLPLHYAAGSAILAQSLLFSEKVTNLPPNTSSPRPGHLVLASTKTTNNPSPIMRERSLDPTSSKSPRFGFAAAAAGAAAAAAAAAADVGAGAGDGSPQQNAANVSISLANSLRNSPRPASQSSKSTHISLSDGDGEDYVFDPSTTAVGDSLAIIQALMRVHPEGIKLVDEAGRLPVEYASSLPVLDALIAACPHSIEFVDRFSPLLRDLVYSTEFSYETLIAENHLLWFRLIQAPSSISLQQNIQTHVEAYPDLAFTRDANGRSAIDLATPAHKKVMQSVFLWFKRYRVLEAHPDHVSSTCLVFKAADEADVDPITEQPRRIALKLMRYKHQFLKEVTSRTHDLSAEFVIEVLRTHPTVDESAELDDLASEVDIDTISGTSPKLMVEGLYCIAMPLADRNLWVSLKQDRFAGRDLAVVKHVIIQVIKAVAHIHQKGLVHADIKPLNIVRMGSHWKIIDLDACCQTGIDCVGSKVSTAYIPPEAVVVLDEVTGQCCVRSAAYRPPLQDDSSPTSGFGSLPAHVPASLPSFELLYADPSFDVWSLGCVLYQLCNPDVMPLFHATQDDNLSTDSNDDDSLLALATWSQVTKARKLSKIVDPSAQNLLAQMLTKDPKLRPSIARILAHPFLSGNAKVARCVGQPAKFDVFLSYRVASDSEHVKVLYDNLTAMGVRVWWDRKCLKPGEPWEDGFCAGLINSKTFVCLLSRDAMNHPTKPWNNFSQLREDSDCDNVFLEHRLALELRGLKMIENIFPVLIGDFDDQSKSYGNFFRAQCLPSATSLPGIAVKAVEKKLIEHMEQSALGTPLTSNQSVASVIGDILACQGAHIEGHRDSAFSLAMNKIGEMLKNIIPAPHESGAIPTSRRKGRSQKAQEDVPHSATAVNVVGKHQLLGEDGISKAPQAGHDIPHPPPCDDVATLSQALETVLTLQAERGEALAQLAAAEEENRQLRARLQALDSV